MEQKHFHFNEKKRVVVKIGRPGAADDDLSAAFCGIQSGGRAGADDEEHDGEPCLERECEEYVR